jgi:hypothetical protein
MPSYLPGSRPARKSGGVPFTPAFMHDLVRFRAELAAVRSPADWHRFKAAWFADQPWPRREAEAGAIPRPPLVHAGRTFQRGALPDQLAPEARYQYFVALAHGFSALFPPAERPGAPGVAIRWSCPACLLHSDEPGPPDCPECGRPLIAMRHAPPP